MEFLYPGFFYGLFAIAIPIIIHLFNFRRFKRIDFTNVKFLEQVKQQTKKQSQVKHLLVLLTRILAIAALVTAFARPYIPLENNRVLKGKKMVSVYIDNSFSMEAISEKGMLFEASQNIARDIIQSYKPVNDFHVITNDFKGKHQRIISKEEASDFIYEMEISPARKTISNIISRQKDITNESNASVSYLYLLSDFQKNICDLENIEPDTTTAIFFIPLKSGKTNNLFIDNCWFTSPVLQEGQQVTLFSRIVNNSNEKYEQIPAKLIINKKQRALTSFTIEAGSDVTIELPFTINHAGTHAGHVEITDHPVVYDDKFYLNFQVKKTIPILSISGNGHNKYINSLFGKDSLFDYHVQKEDAIDFSNFQEYQLIILNELKNISSGLSSEINSFMKNGGTVLFIPSVEPDIQSYNTYFKSLNINPFIGLDTTKTEISNVNIQHKMFKDVFEEFPKNMDLPKVHKYYKTQERTISGKEYLLNLMNGSSLLSTYSYRKGHIYVSTVPFDPGFSNFPEHAIFVPVMYKMAFLSYSLPPLYYNLSAKEPVILDDFFRKKDEVLKITGDDNFEIIPGMETRNFKTYIYPYDYINTAGNYYIQYKKETLRGISFNYNRKESELEYLSNEELEEALKNYQLNNISVIKDTGKPMSLTIKQIDEGVQLWKWFIIAALFFLAIEILLLRLWR